MRHPGRRRGARVPALIIGAAIGIVAGVWIAGFFQYLDRVPRADAPAAPSGKHDAIVVLTGGGGRLERGLQLLANGDAKKLFVSGVDPGVDAATLLHDHADAARFLDCCIALGYAASDTRGNARETARWMAAEGFDSLYLVTANYHMPRSLLEFRAALPGAAVVPQVVHPDNVHLEQWWRWPGTARLLAVENTKYLAALLRRLWAR